MSDKLIHAPESGNTEAGIDWAGLNHGSLNDAEVYKLLYAAYEKTKNPKYLDPDLYFQEKYAFWPSDPVSPIQWLTDPAYFGHVGRGTWDVVRQDFLKIMCANPRPLRVILSGSIGLDSIIQERDGRLPTLRERIASQSDAAVAVIKDCGQEFSTTETAHSSGVKCVLDLKLANGMSLSLTPEHEVLTQGAGPMVWREAKDLVPGDFVVVARRSQTIPSERPSPAEVKLLAYWVTNGSFSDTRARYCSGNRPTVDEALASLCDLGFSGTLSERSPRCWEVAVTRTKTSGFLSWVRERLGYAKVLELAVPERVTAADNEALALFVNRVWAAEGTVYVGRNSPPRFLLGMVSERFIRQMQLLLLRLGVQGRVRLVRQFDKRSGKVCRCWTLSVSGKENLQAFLLTIGPILGKEAKCADIAAYCTARKANTNVDVLPLTRGQLSDLMTVAGIVRQVGNPWWGLATARAAHLSRSKFQAWLRDYGSTPLGRRLEAAYPDDAGYTPVVSVMARAVAIPVGDIGAHNGNRFVANGISVHNSIGWGKSFLSCLLMARLLYEICCLKNPQEFFGLSAGTHITLMNLSVSAGHARRVLFDTLRDMIDRSPWFQAKMKRKEDLQTTIYYPRLLLSFIPGSSSELSALGENLFGGVIEEANFFQVVSGSKRLHNSAEREWDQAKRLHDSIWRRMESRYQRKGRVPGMLVLNSSASYPDDFLDRVIREADPNTRVITHAEWETKPTDRYCGRKFFVYVGDAWARARVIPEPDVEEWEKKGRVIGVPVEFRSDFDKDIEAAIRDIAGLNVRSMDRYITNEEKILAAVDNTIPVPFDDVLSDGLLSTELKTRIDLSRLTEPVLMGKKIRNRPRLNPDALRFAHLDLGISKDSAGIAICHIAAMKEVLRRKEDATEVRSVKEVVPMIVVDLVLKVSPPHGGEVQIADIRNLLYDLSQKVGYRFAKITYDQFQSKDSQQILTKRFGDSVVGYLSVVRTANPYNAVKDALYEGRLKYYNYRPLIRELQQLIRDPKTGKIEHPPTGSKDVADGLAGAVWNATANMEMGVQDRAFFSSSQREVIPPEEKQRREDYRWLTDSPIVAPEDTGLEFTDEELWAEIVGDDDKPLEKLKSSAKILKGW